MGSKFLDKTGLTEVLKSFKGYVDNLIEDNFNGLAVKVVSDFEASPDTDTIYIKQ